jgi:rubrerythrin
MGEKTQSNVYEAFVGEAKAYHRLLAFARRADEEEYEQVAKLFRAVAAAEGVHAERHLRLLGEAVVRSTEENLRSSFERETTVNEVYYPRFIQEAEAEQKKAAALTFSQARDVEGGARGALQAGAERDATRRDARLLRLPGVRVRCRTRTARPVPDLQRPTRKVPLGAVMRKAPFFTTLICTPFIVSCIRLASACGQRSIVAMSA